MSSASDTKHAGETPPPGATPPTSERARGASDRARGAGQSHRLVELERPECLGLLEITEFGRVVLTTSSGKLPMIRPVNYRFDSPSQSVVFRTGDGSKFHALARSTSALFEIDSIDPRTRTAWSVIVSGFTEEVTQPAEIRRLEQFGLESWAPGERPHWIRIRALTVSGRSIVLAAPGSGR